MLISDRRALVARWSSYLACEDRPKEMFDYYMHPVVARLSDRVISGGSGLFFLVGLQGSGKTTALIALYVAAGSKGVDVDFFVLGNEKDRERLRVEEPVKDKYRVLFVDLPDYPVGGAKSLLRDLDLVVGAYYRRSFMDRGTIVVAVQKELFQGHYFFGKALKVELPRFTSGELAYVYRRRFKDSGPFTDDALLLLGETSRGVIRRFLKYIWLCVDGTADSASVIGVDDVRRIISRSVVAEDMNLELSAFLKDAERFKAVCVLESLRLDGPRNQKDIARELDLSESGLSRLLVKLEAAGYVRREQGVRKEMIIHPVEGRS
jgi:hypothetical protein